MALSFPLSHLPEVSSMRDLLRNPKQIKITLNLTKVILVLKNNNPEMVLVDPETYQEIISKLGENYKEHMLRRRI